MLYENYEARIKKIANVLKFIFRNMTKIIICLSVMLCITATLLATKGFVYGDILNTNQIYYGQQLDFSAKAFLTSANYQYRDKNSDTWTYEVPYKPGEYYVRAQAKSLFGYRYSDEYLFELKPKQIDVKVVDGNVVYGENPNILIDTEFNDLAICNDFIYNEDKTKASINAQNFKIYNSNGDDVTSSYKINFIDGSINVINRDITLKTEDVSKEYDGKPLYLSDYNIVAGSLASGDTISIDYISSITKVGSIDSEISATIINESGVDVTSKYNVHYQSSKLSITKRNLIFETPSISKTYDGDFHSAINYSLQDTSLAEGDSINIVEFSKLQNVGEINNVINFSILNGDNESVKNNYKITVIKGKITVSKRDITFSTVSDDKVYDASPLQKLEYNVSDGSVCNNQTVIASDWASIIDFGETQNTAIFKIFDLNNEDVSSNYNFTYNFGKLSINKRLLNLTFESSEILYDAKDHYFDNVTPDNLATNDSVVITGYNLFNDVGEYQNELNYIIKNTDREVDVTLNYEITTQLGKILINKRNVTVQTETFTLTYDGTQHLYDDLIISGDGLCENHVPTITKIVSVLNVCENIDNVVELKITKDDVDFSKNYNLIINYGKLSVIRRPITIYTATNSKVYNDEPLQDLSFTNDNLVEFHNFIPTNSTSITNVNIVKNEFLNYDILDDNEESVIDNYSISFENGTLTVLPRPIVLVTDSASKIYDAKPLTKEGVLVDESSEYDLVKNHVASILTTGNIINVGSVDNTYEGEVTVLAGDVNVTYNYNVLRVELGVLTVIERPIYVTTNNIEFTYDGEEHFDSALNLTVNDEYFNLCENHEFSVTHYDKFIDYCENEVNEVFFNIICGDENLTYNYDITTVYGDVIAYKRTLTVTTDSDIFTYDGKYHSVNVINGDNLAFDDEIVVDFVPEFKNAGQYDNEIQYHIYNFNRDVDVTLNYDITDVIGVITINKRYITVTTDSDTFTYDGYDHDYNFVTIGGLGLAENEGYDFVSFTTVNDVVFNKLNEAEIYLENANSVNTTNNYEIEYVKGLITVNLRPIFVTTNKIEFTYDGIEHSDSTLNLIVNSEYYDLCDNHYFDVTYCDKFIDYCEGEKNVVNFDIVCSSGSVLNNYDIITEYESVTVYKRQIVITTQSETFIYNGEGQYYNVASANDLVNNDEIVVNGYNSFVNVDVYENYLNYYFYNYDRDVDVTLNYDVVEEIIGTITILPRPIVLVTNSDLKIYDATPLTKKGAIIDESSEYDLVFEHNVIITTTGTITNVGETENTYDGVVSIFAEDEDVTYNYDIVDVKLGKLVVIPRPIYVTTNNIEFTYDGEEHFDLDLNLTVNDEYYSLCENHEFSVTYYDKFIDYCENEVNEVFFNIICGDENLTYNYDITTVYGDVIAYKRTLTVTTDSDIFTYDGKYHSVNVINGDNLAFDDEIVVDLVPEFKNAGQYDNEIQYHIYNFNRDVDVTLNYDITDVIGKIIIQKRQITVTTQSEVFMYNGAPQSNTHLEIGDMLLAENHYYVIDEFTSVLDHVINEENVIIISIFDENDEAVTDNYNIDYINGYLTVNKRPIKVSTNDIIFVYDGEYHSDSTLNLIVNNEFYDLCDNHYFEVTNLPEFIDYCEQLSNEVEFIIVCDGDNVTNNYDIDINYGVVNGYKRDIYITTGSEEFTFDGNEHYCIDIDGDNLVSGDEIMVTNYNAFIELGNYENYLTYLFYNMEREVEVTENYNVIHEEIGYITIGKRPVILTTDSALKSYDGTPLTCNRITTHESSEYSLATGHVATANVLGSQTEIGTSSNYYDGDIKIYCGDEDVTYKYEIIDVLLGELTVTKIHLIIRSDNDSKTYDGTPLTCDKYDCDERDMLSGHYLIVDIYGSQTEIGTSENNFSFKILDDFDNIVLNYYDYYEVECIFGILEVTEPTIEKIHVTVTPEDLYFIYDGETHYAGSKVNVVGLESYNDSVYYTVQLSGSQTEVGSSKISVVDFKIFNVFDEDITDLFDVEYKLGNIEVYNGEILIYLYEMNIEYDGKMHSLSSSSYAVLSIPHGFDIIINSIMVSLEDVGIITSSDINESITSYIDFNVYKGNETVYDFNVKVCKFDNYSDYDVITITQREISIKTNDAEKEYDGTPLTNNGFTVNGLVVGHKVNLEVTGSIISKGTTENLYNRESLNIVDEYGNDVTSNYNVVEISIGKLTVK